MGIDYLLVGGGIAAARAVQGIRLLDPDGRVALVSEEDTLPYFRPLISYLLAGKSQENNLSWRPQEFFQEHGVELHLGRRAVIVDTDSGLMGLDNGEEISFSKLLLATGGRPLAPPIAGLELEGVYTFNALRAVSEIRDYISRHRVEKVTIIGGGLIGLKAGEAFSHLGIKISLVELQPQLLPTVLDTDGGNLLAQVLESKGWDIHLQRRVNTISGQGRVTGVRLDDGTVLGADLVILAAGVRPNTELAEKAGLEINQGILVDDYLQTSKAGIYAAGDVAESWDRVAGMRRVLALWPVASSQGFLAGFNMAGGERRYEGGMAVNATSLLGFPMATMGLSNAEVGTKADLLVIRELKPADNGYRRLVFQGDRLAGAILMGDGEIDRAGILTGLIKTGWPVRQLETRLMNPDLGLIDFPDAYQATLLQTARSGQPVPGGERNAS